MSNSSSDRPKADDDAIITFDRVWERFVLQGLKGGSLKSRLLGRLTGRPVGTRSEYFEALRDVSFTIRRGEVVGLVGENGSGKSTVLNLIAGIYQPDRGHIEVKGKVSALLELGTGFHPELTGRENVILSGSLLGLSHRLIDERLPAIEQFAGIGRFIDIPIKSYSSGMYVRLAFALAISVDAEILLIDEVLAVGDHAFQQQCYRRILEFREQGRTILYVSHDAQSVKNLCSRALLFRDGRLLRDGDTRTTLDFYLQTIGRKEAIVELTGSTFSLLFNNGRITLFQGERLVTSEGGLHTTLYGREQDIASLSGYWRVLLQAANRLVVEGTWPFENLRQTWEISLAEHAFDWRIAVTGDRTDSFHQFSLHAGVTTAYEHWEDVLARGDFPRIFPDDRDRIFVTGNVANSGYIGLSGDETTANLSFERRTTAAGEIVALSSNEYAHPGRVISFSDSLAASVARNEPAGEIHRTAFRIALDSPREEQAARRSEQLDRISLQHGSVTLIFTGSHFHLLSNLAWMTGMLGMYVSLKSGGFWHDTAQAWWSISRQPDRILGTCRLKRIPVSQEWLLFFEPTGRIRWQVTLEFHQPVPLERLQANIMLSERYSSWTNALDGQGSFPGTFKDDFGGDWEVISSHAASTGPITVSAVSDERLGLPGVSLEARQPPAELQANIINTDSYFRGRLLQLLTIPPAGRELHQPGKINLVEALIDFSGEIPIAGRES